MKLCTKLVVTLLTTIVSLQYYCQNYNCSDKLNEVCYYSAPSNWDELLTENSEMYKVNVHPKIVLLQNKYQENVGPHVELLLNNVNERVITPASGLIKNYAEDFNCEEKLQCVKNYWQLLCDRVTLYYAITLRPYYERFAEEFGAKTRYSSFQSKFNGVYDQGKKVVTDNYRALQSKYSSLVSTVSIEVSSPISSSKPEVNVEEAEELITSTIFTTVTLDDGVEAQATGTVVSNNDLSMEEQALLQNDFENWSNTVEKKIQSVIGTFEKDVDRAIQSFIDENEANVRDKMRYLATNSDDYLQKIAKAIQDIDCKIEIDSKTGEKRYFDKTGTTELPVYIDRQLMRDYFDEAQIHGTNVSVSIRDDLSDVAYSINKKIEGLRDEYVDLYEEWANTVIGEWSKRMAYVDVIAAHMDEDEQGTISEQNWKKFMELKRDVMDAREGLINHPISAKKLEDFMNEVQRTLTILGKERADFTYILRSKANLAFQKREKEEKERASDLQESETEVAEEK
ncbi:hypothetical protein KAFR_0J02770 [Kazachstania africana CBS 2517]|uniref:Outer spore wall assembly protein SHE10 n=1 Tax=Kazachstania africana (strain ATCC 22294 / BCRC 22015 / CBS 2517 / CECT 1963 / NBRC 1671 / NRRL Y-8276) TaxID=1071382 RepID=H2B141_KAZAF|nr:hypothetical protein KAFR_0J02770 [Kazachstania africana CBS 2517]CCF60341.1 hypothetical protein KAFR_0J02770 [Kazachstania africana CBS 2517]